MIEIFDFDDWVILLVDGEVEYQGHTLDSIDLLNILDIEYKHTWVDKENFPQYVEDIEDGDALEVVGKIRNDARRS